MANPANNPANNAANNAASTQPLTRIATYGYDAGGRANLSVRGEPARLQIDAATNKPIEPKRLAAGTGQEQITLAWPKGGVTVLTNSLGQDTATPTQRSPTAGACCKPAARAAPAAGLATYAIATTHKASSAAPPR